MSGVGGSTGGGGGSGSGGAGNDVAQELAEVKEEIRELKKAIEVQQHELKAAGWTFERIADNAQLAAKEQRLVELQKEKNRIAERQERERQQQQSGEHLAPLPLFPMCPLRVLLPPARCAFNWGDAMGDRGAVSSALFVPHVLIRASVRHRLPCCCCFAPFDTARVKSLFGDGLPPLGVARGSVSKGSVNKEHGDAALTVGTFAVVSELGNLLIPRPSKMVWEMYEGKGGLDYVTEHDIQLFVEAVIIDAISAVGLTGMLGCFNELSVSGLRPDIWVVKQRDGKPVGVVEVKKPGPAIMEEPKLHGQIYDYMMRLQSFFGLRHVFGIATTYESWRVYWLAGDSEGAAGSASIADGAADSVYCDEAIGEEDGGDEEVAAEVADMPPNSRLVHGSGVLAWNDPNLPNILGSVLLKMNAAPHGWVKLIDPFRPYIIINEKAWVWKSIAFRPGFRLHHSVLPESGELILLRDLGAGADGRVWYACSLSGRACVVKFLLDEGSKTLVERLEAERRHWLAAHPDAPKATIRTFDGRRALMMPYARPKAAWTDEDRENIKDACKRMVGAGLVHEDAKARHVGWISPAKQGGQPRAVLFDLGHVTEVRGDKETDKEKEKEEGLAKMLRELELS